MSGAGAGPHVRPEHPGHLLHGVARDLHLLLEAPVRVDGLLEGLLDALAGLVHHPAVVHAAQAVLLGYAVGEVDAAVGAEALDEAERAGPVLVEDEVLAEEAHRLGGALVEFRRRGEGVPVAAHQFAHRRAGADLREAFVVLCGEHRFILPMQADWRDCSTGRAGRTAIPRGWRAFDDYQSRQGLVSAIGR